MHFPLPFSGAYFTKKLCRNVVPYFVHKSVKLFFGTWGNVNFGIFSERSNNVKISSFLLLSDITAERHVLKRNKNETCS